MSVKTFEEWSALGYRVRKGSKAGSRGPVSGKPQFSDNQVYKPNTRRRSYRDVADFDMEEDRDLADAYGISPWGSD
jgi:hypothetical protein